MDRPGHSLRIAPGAIATLAILVAACAQTGGGATPVASQAATQAPASTAAASAVEAATVEIAHDAKLGDYLTGEGGRTLYLFTRDSPGVSTCTDACAATWPPFTLAAGAAVEAGSGVTGTLGSLERADGSTQVTVNDRPLYYFGGDSAAGDLKGQGLNGVWYVISPAGEPGGAGGSPAPTSDGGYSY